MTTDEILAARLAHVATLMQWPAPYVATLLAYLTDPEASLDLDLAEAFDAQAEAVEAFSRITDLAIWMADLVRPDRDHGVRLAAIVAASGDVR